MTETKAKSIEADLQKSLDFLNGALSKEKDAYMMAAVIQAFEICIELSWKFMQAKLVEDSGIIANSPKSSIREYAAAGLTTNPELWLEFIDLRNLSVHTYRQVLAEEMYSKIKSEFPGLVLELIATNAR